MKNYGAIAFLLLFQSLIVILLSLLSPLRFYPLSKRRFTLPLLREQPVTVLNWLGKDNFVLAKIPLLF